MKCYLNSFILHWSCQYFCLISLPSPSLHSLPPSLCLSASFSFFSLWTAYCSILKVPVCVLSCPLLPSMHHDDLVLCRLRMGAHFWCWERVEGEDSQTLWCCFIYSFPWSPSVPAAVIDLKSAPPSFFFLFFPILALKSCPSGWKITGGEWNFLQTGCVSQHVVLMWPRRSCTGESSNCQAERAVWVCGCVCVCVCKCVV